ncbi:MAG: hypothetical protein EOM34_11800 [Clostridia bacterium]|nr:type II toxin-antitoxin system RelE/ParE family toxin [Lachnospiraceae bacterium]NCC01338.1 hypothetical protein [Clostridia bacterium]NCD03178.1 hypothetical protein [Clostridia bacterium]
MKIHNYTSNSGRDLIFEYIESLTEKEQVDAYSVIQCLENGEMDRIKFKRWEKKVYEVYFYKDNRIFYIVEDGNNMYLLHACRKQKNQTEKRDAKIVKLRARELGRMLGKSFI